MSLEDKALNDCLQHARQVFSGELKVETNDATEEWDPTLLRNVLDQSMVIKREMYDFEVTTDKFGMLAGFIYHAHWEDCQYHPVDDNQLLAIARETGWLACSSRVKTGCQRGERNEAVIEIGVASDDDNNIFQAGFNTTTNKMIYLLPKGVDPYA